MDSGGPKEACIRWGFRSLCESAFFRGKAIDNTAVRCAKQLNRSRCCLGCGLGLAQGTMYYMEVQIPVLKRAILGDKSCLEVLSDTLLSSVQKRLNRSRFHLGCGLWCAEGSLCYMGGTLMHPGEYD